MMWQDIEWTITVLLGIAAIVGPMFGSEVAVLLLFVLAILNLLLLVTFGSLYISRDLSFSITEFLFFMVWYPISSLSSLPFDVLIDGPNQNHARPNLQFGVSIWMRHVLFILSLFGLNKEHVVLLSISWFIGFRVFVSFLAHSVTIYEESSSNIAIPISVLGLHARNLPFIAAEFMFCMFFLGVYYRLYSLFEITATMAYFIVSDKRLQRFMTKQVGQWQVDFLEGLEMEYCLGVLILADCVLCCMLFACAMRRGDYFAVLLSYSNGFIALMEFRTRVWTRIQSEQHKLEDVRRASSLELASHNDICPVCLCVMTSARVTRCGHIFHGKCLRMSLYTSSACPMCKEKLPETNSTSAVRHLDRT